MPLFSLPRQGRTLHSAIRCAAPSRNGPPAPSHAAALHAREARSLRRNHDGTPEIAFSPGFSARCGKPLPLTLQNSLDSKPQTLNPNGPDLKTRQADCQFCPPLFLLPALRSQNKTSNLFLIAACQPYTHRFTLSKSSLPPRLRWPGRKSVLTGTLGRRDTIGT